MQAAGLLKGHTGEASCGVDLCHTRPVPWPVPARMSPPVSTSTVRPQTAQGVAELRPTSARQCHIGHLQAETQQQGHLTRSTLRRSSKVTPSRANSPPCTTNTLPFRTCARGR